MLKQRIITAIVLLAALLAAAAAGRLAIDAPLAVVLGAAAYEWLRLAQHRRRLCVIAGLALAAALLGLQALGHGLPGRALAILLAAACAAWLMIALQVLRGAQRGARGAHPLSTLLALFLLAAAWFALMRLMDDGFVYLLSVLAVVWLADIAAYFAGRRWGRRKLAPAISPGKTWAGVGGAVVAVLAAALVVARLAPGTPLFEPAAAAVPADRGAGRAGRPGGPAGRSPPSSAPALPAGSSGRRTRTSWPSPSAR